MGQYLEPRTQTFKAAEDLSAKQYHFVDFAAADGEVQAVDAVGDDAVGILMNKDVTLGCAAEVAMLGGGAMLKIAGTITRGQLIKTDANGQGVVVAADTDKAKARALQSGVAGDIIEVERVDLHVNIV